MRMSLLHNINKKYKLDYNHVWKRSVYVMPILRFVSFTSYFMEISVSLDYIPKSYINKLVLIKFSMRFRYSCSVNAK